MNPPAGWHPDPYDPNIERFWDGRQWTDQTRPLGSDSPIDVFGTIGQQTGQPATERKKWPWIAGGVAVAIFAAMVAVEHAKASTAGCSVKRPDLSFSGLVFDYFGSAGSDPCTTSGLWKVPSQIRPGTYHVIPTGTFDMGSWTLCATSACRLGTPEMIDHTFITEPSVLTIPANAKYIRTNDVRLEPVN